MLVNQTNEDLVKTRQVGTCPEVGTAQLKLVSILNRIIQKKYKMKIIQGEEEIT